MFICYIILDRRSSLAKSSFCFCCILCMSCLSQCLSFLLFSFSSSTSITGRRLQNRKKLLYFIIIYNIIWYINNILYILENIIQWNIQICIYDRIIYVLSIKQVKQMDEVSEWVNYRYALHLKGGKIETFSLIEKKKVTKPSYIISLSTYDSDFMLNF